jgi:hypothetical protein
VLLPVVNVHCFVAVIEFPARSFTAVVIVAMYWALEARLPEGSRVDRVTPPLSVDDTDALCIAPVETLVSVNDCCVILLLSISSLNVATILLPRRTLVAPSLGVVEVTVGAVLSTVKVLGGEVAGPKLPAASAFRAVILCGHSASPLTLNVHDVPLTGAVPSS